MSIESIRRFIAAGLISALALVIIFDLSIYGVSACACGTWNGWVIAHLNRLEIDLEEYSSAHAGKYPSYPEFVEMASLHPDRPPVTGGLIAAQHEFRFISFPQESIQIGYAVSPDLSQYILVGMGYSYKHVRISLLGRELIDYGTRISEHPVFYPGDEVPKDSVGG